MTVPAHIAGNVSHDAAAGNDPAGPAGKEILDDGSAARQQAMRVAALRHALARNIQPRKRIAFQHRDDGVEIRQCAGCQHAAHAGADHDRMLANVFHRPAPALFHPHPQGLRWYGAMIGRVLG